VSDELLTARSLARSQGIDLPATEGEERGSDGNNNDDDDGGDHEDEDEVGDEDGEFASLEMLQEMVTFQRDGAGRLDATL
jgi:hypothetical protein